MLDDLITKEKQIDQAFKNEGAENRCVYFDYVTEKCCLHFITSCLLNDNTSQMITLAIAEIFCSFFYVIQTNSSLIKIMFSL